MNLDSLYPPTLIGRLLDDLGAIAGAARRLPELERGVLEGVRGVQAQLDQITAALAPLPVLLEDVRDRLGPIQELHTVRAGIEPLDDDMRRVRESVDGLEPLLETMNDRLAGLDKRIAGLRDDLAPLGELADKIPGIG
jgi:ABC-type transporter Mla subunit MlaD